MVAWALPGVALRHTGHCAGLRSLAPLPPTEATYYRRDMIPSTISATHVRQAASEIKVQGIPKGREADKFHVLVDGEGFPPKYILSIAARFATGTELGAGAFSGGPEANTYLENLGFKVVLKNQDWTREECLLVIWAYDRMDQDRGLVKKHLYEELGPILGRTSKSVEFKLQNVSACDPRPRAEKPINEAANKQQLLKEVFEDYWADRPTGRVEALALKGRRTPKRHPWDLAIQRIKSAKSPNTYMPIAVISAVELIQEGQATAVAIPFDRFEERFDALQGTLGEGAVGMGWEPFLHLAATASIWTLMKGSEEVPYNRADRPRGKAQLLKVADLAAFIEELQAGVGDPTLIPRLKALIGATSQKPTADPVVLAAAVEALKGKLGPEPPPGNQNPKQTEGMKKSYVRDPKVVRWVLDRAQGICELCLKPAPFSDAVGEPFLEVHHVVLLADKGPDTVENARGLCPNCHREIHLGLNKRELKGRLLEQRS